jgi:hypothetical protein
LLLEKDTEPPLLKYPPLVSTLKQNWAGESPKEARELLLNSSQLLSSISSFDVLNVICEDMPVVTILLERIFQKDESANSRDDS